MEEKWKSRFKDKLEDYQCSGEDYPWEDIEAALGEVSRPSRPVVFLKWAIGAAAVVAGLFAVINPWRDEAPSSPIVEVIPSPLPSESQINGSYIANDELLTENVSSEIIPTSSPALKSTKISSGKAVSIGENEPKTMEVLNGSLEESTSDDIHQSAEMPSEQVSTDKAEASQSDSRPSKSEKYLSFADEQDFMIPTEKKSERKISAKLYGGVAPSSTTSQYSRSILLSPSSLMGEDSGVFSDSNNEYVPYRSGTFDDKERHSQPIRFGVSVVFPIGDRFFIESGLRYSYLHSTFSSSAVTGSNAVQNLHFAGIPLKAGADIYSSNKVRVYASAGAMAEKMVKGKISHDGYSNSLSMKKLQYSLSVNAGAEYSLAKRLSLYLEPGLSWYPDNGTSINSFYSDKPLFFDILLGLRVNFAR